MDVGDVEVFFFMFDWMYFGWVGEDVVFVVFYYGVVFL